MRAADGTHRPPGTLGLLEEEMARCTRTPKINVHLAMLLSVSSIYRKYKGPRDTVIDCWEVGPQNADWGHLQTTTRFLHFFSNETEVSDGRELDSKTQEDGHGLCPRACRATLLQASQSWKAGKGKLAGGLQDHNLSPAFG